MILKNMKMAENTIYNADMAIGVELCLARGQILGLTATMLT